MAYSLYDISVPAFIRMLGNLSDILDKGRAFADEKEIAHDDLLGARLFEDMAPLASQIQRASDSAKFLAVRVGRADPVAMPDDEKTFDDLKARIAKTITVLESVAADATNGREQDEVVLVTQNGSIPFTAENYVLGFAIPNFYFHVTTAYAILRMQGVPVGKMDFLGKRA